MRFATSLLALAAFLALLALLPEAEATHYRWGVLSWEPTGVENEVRFTGNHGWRRSAFSYPNVGSLVNTGSLDTGDGSHPLIVKVTTISESNDWFIGKFVNETGVEGIRHRYPSPNNGGQPWVVRYDGCCRISPHSAGNFHVNNPDLSQSLETMVDLAGEPNSSPKTILRPINQCPVESDCTIYVPVTDEDGDALSFRLATSPEAGGPDSFTQPGLPHAPSAASIGATDGVIRWNTRGATYSETERTLYSMAIMVQDGRTKTPLDFFIELVPPSVVPPHWVIPPSACGATISIGIGASFEFEVRAASADANRTVTINHLGLPEGSIFPLPPPGNPTSGVFRWTPTHTQAGTHLAVFIADDDRGYQAPICPVTLIVLTGDYEAWGFGVTVEADDVSVLRQPFAHVRDPLNTTFATQQAGPVNVTGLAFAFDGNASFYHALYFAGHARATSLAGRVLVPGVLEAEGVSLHAESVVDEQGAESWSELTIARLRIGGVEIDARGLSGPNEYRVPGVATVRVNERVDSGDGRLNANVTAYAFHVIFDRPSPVRDVYVLGATANVGLHVRGFAAAHGVFDHLQGEAAESGQCVEIAERTRQERVPVAPFTITGDEELLLWTGGSDDGLPLVIQDLEIAVPQGGQGIVIRDTTLPLVIRNVRFVGTAANPYGAAADGPVPRAQVMPASALNALATRGIDSSLALAQGPGPAWPGADALPGLDGASPLPWAGVVLVNASRVTIEGAVFERMDLGVGVAGARLPGVACSLFEGQRLAGLATGPATGYEGESLTVTESRFFANGEPGSTGVHLATPPSGARVAIVGNAFRALGNGGVRVLAPGAATWSGSVVAISGNDFHDSRAGGLAVEGPVADSEWTVAGNLLTNARGSLVGVSGPTRGLSIALEGNVLRASDGGALDLWRDADSLSLAGGANVGVDNRASLLGIRANLTASTVALRGGVVAGSEAGAFDFWGNVTASDVRIGDVGAHGLARGLVQLWEDVTDSAITIDGARVSDTTWSSVDFWGDVTRSQVTLLDGVYANLVDNGGRSGVTFWGTVRDSAVKEAGGLYSGNPIAGLEFASDVVASEVHVTGATFLLNDVAGVLFANGARDSEVAIRGSLFVGASTGSRIAHGVLVSGETTGSFEIRSNLLVRNADGVRLENGASPAVLSNVFADNARGLAAIHREGAFVTALVRDNQFARNAEYGVAAEWAPGAPDLDARENWWGHHTGPGGAGTGSGDLVSSFVLFEPWHLTPVHAILGGIL